MTVRPTLPASVTDLSLEYAAGYNAHICDNGHWTQEVIEGINPTDMVAAAALAPGTYPQSEVNLLVNGGFDLWQRGTSFSTTTTAPTADGWAGTQTVVTRYTTGTDNSAFAVQLAPAAGYPAKLAQTVYEMQRYAGKTVSVSARISSAYTGATVSLYDGTTTATSPALLINDGTFQTLGATLTLSTVVTTVVVTITAPVTIIVMVDNVMLTPTAAPVAFQPLPPAVEWERARRRYAVYPLHYRFFSQAGGSTHVEAFTVSYPLMLAAPTVTLAGGTVANMAAASPSLAGTNTTSTTVNITALNTATDTYAVAGTITVDSGL
jgi:hypothetical protein